MRYDLKAMANKARPRRKGKAIRIRPATKTREDELYLILRQVVQFWKGRIRELEPAFQMSDAMPTAGQIAEEQEEANRLVQILIAKLDEWVQRSGDWVRKLWVGRIKLDFGIDIDMLATNQAGNEMVRSAAEWAGALIRDLSDSTRNKLVGTLASAVSNGLESDEVAREIRNVFKMSDGRARLIARDQTQKIFSKINEAQQKEGGIDKYIWNHSFLPNARRHHVERQGNVYSWSKPPRGGHPGTEINCRCTASAYVDS